MVVEFINMQKRSVVQQEEMVDLCASVSPNWTSFGPKRGRHIIVAPGGFPSSISAMEEDSKRGDYQLCFFVFRFFFVVVIV